MEETGVLTGQYVRIMQPTASVGDRILAQLADWFVQLAYLLFVLWVTDLSFDNNLEWFFFCAILPVMLYPLLCEILNNGQTLGKMLMRMRVVMADGSTPSLGTYLLRYLLIIVDGPSLCYLGAFAIMITRRHQRLGDLAAGTVVVKLQPYERNRISLDDFSYLSPGYKPRYPAAAELSLEQVNVITRALATDNERRIDLLADKVEDLLGVKRHEEYTVLFLQTVVHDYQYYALEAI